MHGIIIKRKSTSPRESSVPKIAALTRQGGVSENAATYLLIKLEMK
jgi:hypothetical protein